MSENDPAVGFDEVLAVVVDFTGSGAAIVQRKDFRGDPLRIEAITNGVGAKCGNEDVGRTDAFAAIEGEGDVGEDAEAGDSKPDELGEYRFRDFRTV